MKRWIAGLFIVFLLLYNDVGAVCAEEEVGAEAAAATAGAKAACILEQSSGRVLYEQNADAQLPMASTTKVMTALLALERCELTEPVRCGKAAYGVPGTSIYLGLGETLTMEEMLQGLMLASGNDAAVAIAEHIGGSVAGFAELMNQRAQELGATRTHFITPHGLPMDNHYTTARDLATIAREAMRHEVFRRIVSTQRASIPWEGHAYNRQLRNKNRLLSDYPGATGIKTGYTRAAGRCLVFSARRGELELVGAVLGCPDWFDVAQRLMDQAFAAYQQVVLLGAGERLRSLPVKRGVYGRVDAVLRDPLGAPLSERENPTIVLALPEELEAPLAADQRIGTAQLRAGGVVLCELPVYPAHPVAELTLWNQLARVLRAWCLLA